MVTSGSQPGLERFVGELGAAMPAPDEINIAMIRHWCEVIGDTNPIYLDEQFAARSRAGEIVAPPAMTQVWTMPRYDEPPARDVVSDLYAELDAAGYVSIMATNSDQQYLRAQRLGDRLTATKRIASISPEKTTRVGTGHFVTSEIDIVDAAGELVATQTHRVLKFKSSGSAGSVAPFEPPTARRPRPNVTVDTAFFFEGARAGQLLIQQCGNCGQFQHPPWPACARCHSFDVRPVEVSGRGELHSYTVIHAPRVAPFRTPYLVALVALEEGPRVVAGLIGVERGSVHIGMPLQVEFTTFDDELVLPTFRPRTSRDSAAGPGRRERTLTGDDVTKGMPLPELNVAITRRLVVASALATRDFQPVHHDAGYARERGTPDIFTNIMTTQGFVSRLVTDWSGPDATINSIELRLGATNFPGDLLELSARVSSCEPAAEGSGSTIVGIHVTGINSQGTHVEAAVTLTLPGSTGTR